MATDSRARPRQRSPVWLQGLLCGAVVAFGTPTALLLGVLLGPALVGLLLDREPGRPRARSMLLCGMAVCVMPLQALWSAGHTLATAAALLSSVHTIAYAWAACGAGWLLAEVAPVGTRALLDLSSRARVVRLRALRTRLTKEWGLDESPSDQ